MKESKKLRVSMYLPGIDINLCNYSFDTIVDILENTEKLNEFGDTIYLIQCPDGYIAECPDYFLYNV